MGNNKKQHNKILKTKKELKQSQHVLEIIKLVLTGAGNDGITAIPLLIMPNDN